MRLVVGCPVYERAWILPDWFQGIHDSATADLFEDVQFVFVYTPSTDGTIDLLMDNGAEVMIYDNGTHGETRDWTNPERVSTLANMRNQLLWMVSGMEFDAFLSLDSDIIMNENALESMWSHLDEADAVSPTVQLAADRSIINAFTRRRDGFYVRCKPGYHGRVDVLCAAIMMTPDLVKDQSVRYSYEVRGEDFGWSAAAKKAGYDMMLCNDYVYHAMEKDKPWYGHPS